MPKGVILSHFNLVSNVCQAVSLDRDHMRGVADLNGPQDKVVAFLPLFHIYGDASPFHFIFYLAHPRLELLS